jgi:MFS transporter, DHA2 family, multidrug resistance protein
MSATPVSADGVPALGTGSSPARAGVVLTTLIVVAGVANVNLAVANVALPSIGRGLDTSQTGLNLVAVGFSLGLAASVLYLGALGDRYGRKQLVVAGMVLTIPAGLLAAFAPSTELLIAGRLLGGVAAGMAFPTTLALVSVLWSGPPATKAIALWSGIGGGLSILGPLIAGSLLDVFWWGSVFLVSVPLAVVGLVLAIAFIPNHVNESTDPVDNLGGVLSVVFVAALVLAINFAPEPGMTSAAVGLGAVALAALVAFVVRQRRTRFPLYDLDVARRRLFWVAAVAGIIVFGALMGGMFIGQQFIQNVLGYSTLAAGFAVLPQAIGMVGVAALSAAAVLRFGSRVVLLAGFGVVMAGFIVMLVLWDESSSYLEVGGAYLLVGIGVGLAATPASRALVNSVPQHRSGMASATADLQRDLGGAVMQSILGAVLAAGYATAIASAVAAAPADEQAQVTNEVSVALQRSFGSAMDLANRFPQYASDITAAAQSSFLSGANWAYAVGIAAMGLGAMIVALFFPGRVEELRLVAAYGATDVAAAVEGAVEAPTDTELHPT